MSKEHEELLIARGLPLPPYLPVTRLSCTFAGKEWWAKTPKGWYWLYADTATKRWEHAPLGPTAATNHYRIPPNETE